MISVEGKMYTTIYMTIESAINALISDTIYLIENNDNSSKLNNQNKNILKSLLILKANYKSVVGDIEIGVNGVFDSTSMKFSVSSIDVLKSLYKCFFKTNDLYISSENMEKGVYSYYNVSYHGTPKYKCNLIYKGTTAEELYKALRFLNSNYYDFVKEDVNKKLSK